MKDKPYEHASERELNKELADHDRPKVFDGYCLRPSCQQPINMADGKCEGCGKEWKVEPTDDVCEWTAVECDEFWETSCGASWAFAESSDLTHHEIVFCMKCGGKIQVKAMAEVVK